MMKTSTEMLMMAIVCALPLTAAAQSNDVAYCVALSSKYQRYVATNDPHYRTPTPRTDVSNPMSSCQADASRAIPILEKAPHDARVDLPSRG
jgi:hypothetical protein